jgi:Xaa-Pro aminopeptidase
VSRPRDDAKLDRVRALMGEQDLDALVVRAPDNVLYLTDFWGMKGYDAVVFPREGEPVLICLEASEADAERTAWTSDVRLFRGYDPDDPRPPGLRALDLARQISSEYDRVGIEASMGTQAADRMVGEPTTHPKAWFDAFPDAADATPLLSAARALKTEQEVERMRLANEIAAGAMEHLRAELRPGMTESEAGALWNGWVHAHGTGWEGKVELAHGFSLVWSGPGIRTFTATGSRPIQEHEPTLFEIWVVADGYWCDHTKNLVPGELDRRYAELEERLMYVYTYITKSLSAGGSLAELDRETRRLLAEAGYPGQPSHPICHGVGARAHEPPYAHQAGGGTIEEGMVLALEPGVYWPEGGGLRVEDNFLVTAAGAEKLSPFPDGIVRCA